MRSASGSLTSSPSFSAPVTTPRIVPQSSIVMMAVLRHVHQTARQVAGVGRLQRGVREALAGAVRGDEVLEDRQPFAEVRDDRVLDQFARRAGEALLRLRHQAAHAGQLAHLLLRTAGAGIDHHVERVEPVVRMLQRVEQLLRHPARRAGPDVDDLVVPFALGDEAADILALHFVDALLRLVR